MPSPVAFHWVCSSRCVCANARNSECEGVFLQYLLTQQLLGVGEHVYCHKKKKTKASSDTYTLSLSTRGQWNGKVRMNYEWIVEDVFPYGFPAGRTPAILVCVWGAAKALVDGLYEICCMVFFPWQTNKAKFLYVWSQHALRKDPIYFLYAHVGLIVKTVHQWVFPVKRPSQQNSYLEISLWG